VNWSEQVFNVRRPDFAQIAASAGRRTGRKNTSPHNIERKGTFLRFCFGLTRSYICCAGFHFQGPFALIRVNSRTDFFRFRRRVLQLGRRAHLSALMILRNVHGAEAISSYIARPLGTGADLGRGASVDPGRRAARGVGLAKFVLPGMVLDLCRQNSGRARRTPARSPIFSAGRRSRFRADLHRRAAVGLPHPNPPVATDETVPPPPSPPHAGRLMRPSRKKIYRAGIPRRSSAAWANGTPAPQMI